MDTVTLSIEIIARFFQERIAYQRVASEREPSITHFQIYDSDTFLLQKNCLYLCIDDSFPPCRHIEPGTAIISLDDSRTCEDETCHRCDLLTVASMTPVQLINGVSAVFDQYRSRFSDLRATAESGGSAEDLICAASDIMGLPCALLDVNLDVIAAKGTQEGFANPLWQTIEHSRKPTRCEILDHSDIRLAPTPDKAGHNLSATTAIAGWVMSHSALYRRGRQCATLWVFQTRPGREFDQPERQLIDLVRRMVAQWVTRTPSIKASRDSKVERWLLDVSDGTLATEEDILHGASQVGYDAAQAAEHQLMLIRPRSETQNDKAIEFINRLEPLLPQSIAVLTDYALLALLPTDPSGYLPHDKRAAVDELCVQRECHAVISSSFIHLSDTPRVIAQLTDTMRMVEAEEGYGLRCYHDYLVRQSMGIVMAALPHETLLHPMIRKLRAYDKQNNTDYMKSFEVYLTNRCNISDTARILHMHRNTLLHRIKRIEELLDDNFADWKLRRVLLLSIDYMHLLDGNPL